MNTVFITGGNRGIGAAVAEKFKKCGYNVVITYFSNKERAKDLCDRLGVYAVYCNVCEREDLDNAVKECHSRFGKIDVLINCAGIALKQNVLGSFSEEDFERVFDVNVKGTVNAVNAVLPDMLSLGFGTIVNVSSVWGLDGGSCEALYSASKGAVTALTKSLAKELAPSKIRVNEVAPGFIDTEMNAHISDEDKRTFCENVLLSRAGTAEEVANAVFFLASKESSYVTGQTLRVDGGLN